MSELEKRFETDLELFRKEVQQGAQFFYAMLAIKAIIAENKDALSFVNESPLFWGTNLGALSSAYFTTLGRIFDEHKQSKHNITNFVSFLHENKAVFSKTALRSRKSSALPDEQELSEYIARAYEPTDNDFRMLKRYVNKYRKIYQKNYEDIRHNIFAHKGITSDDDIQKLYSATKILELEKIWTFLNRVYEILWELYHNGRKQNCSRIDYSIKSIMRSRTPEGGRDTIQKMIVGTTQDFFEKCCSRVNEDGRSSKLCGGHTVSDNVGI